MTISITYFGAESTNYYDINNIDARIYSNTAQITNYKLIYKMHVLGNDM